MSSDRPEVETYNKSISVRTLYDEKHEEFELELLAGEPGLNSRRITTFDVFRPGLAFAGYSRYFLEQRVQIVGSTEVSYLSTLPPEVARERIEGVMALNPPCFVVAKGLPVPEYMIRAAEQNSVPVFRTPKDTTPFIHLLTAYLEYKLAPEVCLHATLVDVAGVGLLLRGDPGVGKSECALDLVERGNRLVVDDNVLVTRRGLGILMGSGTEPTNLLKHHLALRGVGLIDIYAMYGIQAIRLQKRIEVVVELVHWKEGDRTKSFDQVGLEDKFTRILGVDIPTVTIPVASGKNISVIVEVIAMQHLLRIRGFHPAQVYNEELLKAMRLPRIDPFISDDQE